MLAVVLTMAALALAIAAVLAVMLASIHALDRSADRSRQSEQVVAATNRLFTSLIDVETGVRGFVITGRSDFLQPFERATASLPGEAQELDALLAGEPAERAEARQIATAIESYVGAYALPLIATARTNRAAAQSVPATLAGKRRVDAIRARFNGLVAIEQAMAQRRRRDARATASSGTVAAIIGLVVLVGLAVLVGIYIARLIGRERAATEREYRTAQALQRSLLPDRLPAIPGVALAARYRPAGRYLVGGDFYDVFPVGSGRWLVAMGDVVGKGPEAASLTALARYTLRAEAAHASDPAALLVRLNAAIRASHSEIRLCSVVCAILERVPDGVEVTFASGGHPLPLMATADGDVSEVGRHGMLLGVTADPPIHETTLRLSARDSLVFYTDGLSEAHAPDLFLTPEDIAAVIAPLAARDAGSIAAGLEAASGPPEGARDDLAILVLQADDGDGAGRASPDHTLAAA